MDGGLEQAATSQRVEVAQDVFFLQLTACHVLGGRWVSCPILIPEGRWRHQEARPDLGHLDVCDRGDAARGRCLCDARRSLSHRYDVPTDAVKANMMPASASEVSAAAFAGPAHS